MNCSNVFSFCGLPQGKHSFYLFYQMLGNSVIISVTLLLSEIPVLLYWNISERFLCY